MTCTLTTVGCCSAFFLFLLFSSFLYKTHSEYAPLNLNHYCHYFQYCRHHHQSISRTVLPSSFHLNFKSGKTFHHLLRQIPSKTIEKL